MKKLTILIVTTTLFQICFGQVVESSCEAPDSITEDYRIDASVMTLRKFYDNNLPYKDSIEIPVVHVDTVLDALIAVWNAVELPARDTVVNMLNIAAAFDYDVKVFRIKCDTTILWARQLIGGALVSDNEIVDSLMDEYDLRYYFHVVIGGYYYLYLISNHCYNMPQLARLFESVDGVISVFAANGYNANIDDDITAEIQPEFISLEYSYGWGDCLNGCLYWRYWVFRVFYDCSVEYLGSYGNLLPELSIGDNEFSSQIDVYPNPFDQYVDIEGVKAGSEFALYNLQGQLVVSGIVINNRIDLPDKLSPGMYLLKLSTNKKDYMKKIMKKY